MSACVITTTPNAVMAPIHERMPLVLPRQHFDAWLDPAMKDIAVLKQWLVPAAAGAMRAYPVGSRVGNARNEGSELIEAA